MKKFHPFFVIGTVGTIVISLLHILFALGLSSRSVHSSFFAIYPVFIAFLMLGFFLTLKKQKQNKAV